MQPRGLSCLLAVEKRRVRIEERRVEAVLRCLVFASRFSGLQSRPSSAVGRLTVRDNLRGAARGKSRRPGSDGGAHLDELVMGTAVVAERGDYRWADLGTCGAPARSCVLRTFAPWETVVSCYCCAIGAATIYQPLGHQGDVLGGCYNCHIAACGHHADRSANKAQYLCMLCVKTLVTASAFLRTRDTDYTRQLLTDAGSSNLLRVRSDQLYATVATFIDTHPRIYNMITANSIAELAMQHADLAPQVREMLDDNDRRLLRLAVALALAMALPQEDIETILLMASDRLTEVRSRESDR